MATKWDAEPVEYSEAPRAVKQQPDSAPKTRWDVGPDYEEAPVSGTVYQKTPQPIKPTIKPKHPLIGAIGTYLTEAQPAFKWAISGMPQDLSTIEKVSQQPWSDIYRESGGGVLPFAKSSTTTGQLIPEVLGLGLDVGTRPSSYVAPMAIGKGLETMAKFPATRRFLQTQTPTLSKPLLEKFPVKPILKETSEGMVDITSPLPSKATADVKFAQKIRGAFTSAKENAVNKFGSDIDNLAKANPDKFISLRPKVEEIIAEIPDMSPETRTVFRKVPLLRDMIKNPELADNVSLKDTQEIINYINTKVPKNIKYTHLDILDTLSDIRAAQLEAFPEMSEARQAYSSFKNSYDLVKGKLKAGSLLKNLADDWKDPEIRHAAEKLLSREVLGDIKNFQRNKRLLELTGIMTKKALEGAALTGGGFTFYHVLRGMLGAK